MLDMATSIVAGGKVIASLYHKKPIPPNWVLDSEGVPSTDPAAFPNGGSLMPMAGHKGYGIALLIESLSGLVSGACVTWQMLSWSTHDPTKTTGHGAAFIAIDVGAMESIAEFKKRADDLVNEIRSAPKAKGSDKIMLPGDFEADNRERALAEGIVLPADVVASMSDLATELKFKLQDWFPQLAAAHAAAH